MNTEQDNALLPCPFCGEAEGLIIQHCEGTIIHPALRIYCDNCGASSRYSDRVDPVENWNRRAALQHSCKEKSQDRELDDEEILTVSQGIVEERLRDKEDAERWRYGLKHGFPQKWEEMVRGNLRIFWTSKPGSQEEFSSAVEAIDHARNIIGGKDAISMD